MISLVFNKIKKGTKGKNEAKNKTIIRFNDENI